MFAELDGRKLAMAVRAEPIDRQVHLPADREEAQWIARAKTGDEAAFGWLLARYRQNVLRLAVQVLRRESEAEDAAQEAFLRVFSHIRAFRADARFSTWLYRIVVRVCLDRRRLARWQSESASLEENCAFDSSLEASSGQIETRLLVDQLMQQISPPIRAALVLSEIEGLEYGEIAQALSIPVGTVRSRLSAARALFRALWDQAMRENTGE